ncbi:hypothetical protein T492DRAFT_625613 [Pavlovales sp. CCMP2436]|nr:hypothetical protein T492DRAFT_625613 [Pavlovales sp. CCMP2436]
MSRRRAAASARWRPPRPRRLERAEKLASSRRCRRPLAGRSGESASSTSTRWRLSGARAGDSPPATRTILERAADSASSRTDLSD